MKRERIQYVPFRHTYSNLPKQVQSWLPASPRPASPPSCDDGQSLPLHRLTPFLLCGLIESAFNLKTAVDRFATFTRTFNCRF